MLLQNVPWARDKFMMSLHPTTYFQQPWGKSKGENEETKRYEDGPNSRLGNISGLGSNPWNCPKSRSRLGLGVSYGHRPPKLSWQQALIAQFPAAISLCGQKEAAHKLCPQEGSPPVSNSDVAMEPNLQEGH